MNAAEKTQPTEVEVADRLQMLLANEQVKRLSAELELAKQLQMQTNQALAAKYDLKEGDAINERTGLITRVPRLAAVREAEKPPEDPPNGPTQ